MLPFITWLNHLVALRAGVVCAGADARMIATVASCAGVCWLWGVFGWCAAVDYAGAHICIYGHGRLGCLVCWNVLASGVGTLTGCCAVADPAVLQGAMIDAVACCAGADPAVQQAAMIDAVACCAGANPAVLQAAMIDTVACCAGANPAGAHAVMAAWLLCV
jgi:hypothetical protein